MCSMKTMIRRVDKLFFGFVWVIYDMDYWSFFYDIVDK